MCGHIEGVIGVQDKQTPLHGVRGRLVELMAWAIEIALMQLFIYQLGEDEIVRRDEYFREQILLQEFDAYSVHEMPEAAEPSAVVGAESDPPLADAPTLIEPGLAMAEESAVPLDHAAPSTPWLVGSSPTMTGEDTRNSLAALSRPVDEPPIIESGARIPCIRASRSWPRLVQSMPDVEAVERPPIVGNLLHDSVRFKRRRRSSPPVVRHRPIERAA